MVRLGRKNRSPGDKENAPQNAESRKPKGLRFRRQKEQRNVASSNAPSLIASEISDQPDPSCIRPFSSLSEMAILHNSVNSVIEDKADFPPPPSTVLQTRSVMRFALQSRMYEEKTYHETWENLCEDPTVEESIECVFEHQLEDGLQMNVEEDDESCMDNNGYDNSNAYSESYYTSGKLVQVGSFSPFDKKRFDTDALLYESQPSQSDLKGGLTKFDAFTCSTCRDGKQPFIGAPPEKWPQAPLLLRPTPGSGTGIIGVRYAGSKEYLTSQWWNDIPNNNSVEVTTSNSFCSKCCCLPINNGNETLGKALVVDFESDLFQGTMQVRIRNSNGTTPEPREDSTGYFDGLNRTYQCVVQGRFKREGIPMISCIAGQSFTKPLNLPPTYIAKGIIRVMNFFAPRLHVRIEGHSPFFVSPLGSTPQVVKIDKVNGTANTHFQACSSISEEQEEPFDQSRQIVPIKLGYGSKPASRSKARKKAFDKLCSDGDDTSTFDTNRVYSFEFLQHLVDFETFDLKLGSIIGKINLSHALNAQPLKIMAAYQRPPRDSEVKKVSEIFHNLWSFDLWHEKAYDAMLKKS